MPAAIVTDSTSDIEPERARTLGIEVVPLFILFGERSYRDYVDLSRAQFYEKLAREKVLPITSQPTASMFEEAFAKHAAAGEDILCITIAQTLSGTINAARAAAQKFPDARIELFDSQTAAGGLGLQVLRAVEMAGGGVPTSQIIAQLTRDRELQRLYAVAPDLSHLVRTGRIGRARAAFGTLMKLVPVLRLRDGVVEAEATVRTLRRAQEVMIDASLREVGDRNSARVMVMHTQAPDLAQRVLEAFLAQLGGNPKFVEILEAGPAIATHAGAGAVGIFTAG
ncbi:MAG: hypothetical protein DLM50_05270 [Candidatus Meridianibacter frigidus]|nr:MAG: hypothetical protein DLM50_05270 [Candidatus Eremiobacteraeota bacterium]